MNAAAPSFYAACRRKGTRSGNANSAPSLDFCGMNLPIGERRPLTSGDRGSHASNQANSSHEQVVSRRSRLPPTENFHGGGGWFSRTKRTEFYGRGTSVSHAGYLPNRASMSAFASSSAAITGSRLRPGYVSRNSSNVSPSSRQSEKGFEWHAGSAKYRLAAADIRILNDHALLLLCHRIAR